MKRLWPLLVSILATLLLLVACAPPAEAQVSFFGWRFEEMQPDIPNGGRANAITVHPFSRSVGAASSPPARPASAALRTAAQPGSRPRPVPARSRICTP